MIDLNRMSRIALKAAKKRETKGQLKSDTFSILKHCAGEVCEATNAWTRWEDVDIEVALLRVQEKNARRAEEKKMLTFNLKKEWYDKLRNINWKIAR